MSPAKLALPATAIFLISLLPRILFLQADPPPDLSWSLAPFTDDPAAMTPARLAVQERQGLVAGSAHPDSNPFVSLLLRAVMSVLGTGIWQGRILFAVAGSGCCVLLLALLRNRVADPAPVLAGLLLAGSFVFVQYNRLALEETLVIFFGLSALALVGRDRPGVWRALAAGGCLAAGAVLVKLHGWLFVPVAALSLCLSAARSHGSWSSRELAARLGAGVAGFVVVWLAGTALGLKPVYAELGQYFRSPAGETAFQPAAGPVWAVLGFLDETLGRYLTIGLGTRLTLRMPMEVLLALVLTLSVASRHPRRWLQMDGATTALFLWLLLGVPSLGLLRYRPLRYELLLVPPLCGLAAIAVSRLVRPTSPNTVNRESFLVRPVRGVGFLIRFILLVPAWNTVISWTLLRLTEWGWVNLGWTASDLLPVWPNWHAPILGLAVLLALPCAALYPQVGAKLSALLETMLSHCRTRIYGVILGACALIQATLLLTFWSSLRYDTFAASEDLATILDSRAVIAGQLADAITIQTSLGSCPCTEEELAARIGNVSPGASHFLARALETSADRQFTSKEVESAVRSGKLSVIRSYRMGPSEVAGTAERVTQVLLRVNTGESSVPATGFELGMMALAAGDPGTATARLEEWAAAHPRNLFVLLNLALLEARRAGGKATETAWFSRARDMVSGPGHWNSWDSDFYRAVAEGF